MTLPVYRLRRLLAATAVLLTLVVGGMYFYARLRVRDVRKEIANKIGYDIKQTANGFQISKSDGKRTLFTIQASDVKQFKLSGDAELHNVNIVLYGRDSSRFDQIYGADFAFSQKTGDVTAKGEVQIDLVANPAGLASPDQSTPKELKNPIHLKTSDLVFNKDTGNATTAARVEFRTPQATGWAVGADYAGKSNALTLSSHIHIVINGPQAVVIDAEHGVITNDPRLIVLDHPQLDRAGGIMQADQATFYLGPDNSVERILATGNVTSHTQLSATKPPSADDNRNSGENQPAGEVSSRADQAEFLLTSTRDLLRTATLTGNVHVEQTGAQPMQGDAPRVVLDFAGQNELKTVHALDGARLVQHAVQQNVQQNAQPSSPPSRAANKSGFDSGPQNFELTAPVIDFTVAHGNLLGRAVTSGAAQITISPASATSSPQEQRTVVTAAKFEAQFATTDGKNHITSLHGAPNARIVNSSASAPDRVSTSESVDAMFLPQRGIESITQQGHVAYSDGQTADKQMQAWAETARYTPADQILVLTGNPRVTNGGMATTAKTIRINRVTGDAWAENDVKSTYSELKEQPDGALLASASPIHVTAQNMTAHGNAGIALYTGDARLWQDANIIEAPSIQFDRDRRFVTAQGTAAQAAKTILVQPNKDQTNNAQTSKTQPEKAAAKSAQGTSGKKGSSTPTPFAGSSPIAITAMKLTYADSERKVHYEGGVLAKGADFTATAKTVDAYLRPRSQTSNNQSFAGPGQLDHMVAEQDVVITQPNRHADGQKLVYTAADDKFVLTGGPPSIFDAEQGKITGVSLTFFRTDDRVLVEGAASTPVVTQTRVAH